MALLTLEQPYLQFANDLLKSCKNANVILSEESELLLNLAAEAWMKDTPPPVLSVAFQWTPNQRRQFAEQVVRVAIQDLHIRLQVNNNRPVPFALFLWTLATSGEKLLSSILAKGFEW
jgi:hypothetical protein